MHESKIFITKKEAQLLDKFEKEREATFFASEDGQLALELMYRVLAKVYDQERNI